MKTKSNVLKKLMLFAATFAFCAVLLKPINADAAVAPKDVYQSKYATNSVTINWTSDVSVKGYEVQIADTNVESAYVSKTTYAKNYYTVYGLNAGTTYFIRLRAYNSASDVSPWQTFRIDTAPNNVTTLTQTSATLNSVTVAWNQVPGASGYDVYAIPYNATSYSKPITSVAGTSYTYNVPTNSKYYIAVVPYRNVANQNIKVTYPTSYPKEVSCVSAPTAPSNAWIYQTNSKSKTVTFKYSSSSYTDNTSGYILEVYRVTNKKGKTKLLKQVTIDNPFKTSADVKSKYLFSAGYKYRLCAYVMINGTKIQGPWSDYYYYTPSALIKNKLKNQTSSTATLSWNKVLGASSYTVWHKTSPLGKWKKVKKNVKGTSATVKYKGSSTYNYYYVQANKSKINSKKVSSPNPNGDKAYTYTEFRKKYYWR